MIDDNESTLVEISPGTAILFGEVPDGLDVVPFSMISLEDKSALVDGVSAASSVLSVGGQLSSALAQA